MTKPFATHRWVVFFFGILAFLFFISFSYVVHKNMFTQSDFDNTVRLQNHMSLRFITPFSFLSDIGKVEIVSVILLIILAIHRKLRTFLAFIFFGLLHFFELYGKFFVSHKAPPHFMLRTHDIFNLSPFFVRTENSYPSGHAGRALFVTALVGVMTLNTKKLSTLQKASIILLLSAYDIVMGISRVYLGEHWTSDVIGGSLLGLSLGLFSSLFI